MIDSKEPVFDSRLVQQQLDHFLLDTVPTESDPTFNKRLRARLIAVMGWALEAARLPLCLQDCYMAVSKVFRCSDDLIRRYLAYPEASVARPAQIGNLMLMYETPCLAHAHNMVHTGIVIGQQANDPVIWSKLGSLGPTVWTLPRMVAHYDMALAQNDDPTQIAGTRFYLPPNKLQ